MATRASPLNTRVVGSPPVSGNALLWLVESTDDAGSERPVLPAPTSAPPAVDEVVSAAVVTVSIDVVVLGSAMVVVGSTDVLVLVGGVVAEVHVVEVAAAGSPELVELWQETLDRRRIGAAAVIGPVADQGGLRPGLGVEEATDIVWAMNGPELYLNLVEHRHWTPAQYTTWLGDAFVALLLPC